MPFDESGHLKTDTLTATGGHQSEGVFAGQHRLNDLCLQRTEIIVTEICLQCFACCHWVQKKFCAAKLLLFYDICKKMHKKITEILAYVEK
jgi:hypothetical protein